MAESGDKPMLGGCCICLDERGWAENPLVYCDGQGCSIAVHQACYGIISVPSGPWFCRRCEVHGAAVQLSCKLCPYQGGALKRADTNDEWVHAVCALYIPEVEFGNVSTMEPILISKLPEERFKKLCYVCEENNISEKDFGACMDCAKTGCKLSFHVICAQMSGLLCEVAGASNKTKYCGYCLHHLSKQKKVSPFKNLACAKVYKLVSQSKSCNDSRVVASVVSCATQSEHTNTGSVVLTETHKEEVELTDKPEEEGSSRTELELDAISNTKVQSEVVAEPVMVQAEVSALPVTSPAIATVCSLEKETIDCHVTPKEMTTLLPDSSKKKTKRKSNKVSDREGVQVKKASKSKKAKANPAGTSSNKQLKSNPPLSIADLQSIGYATAPKHSVISLSEFGVSSFEPSHPSDIGGTKPSPATCRNDSDGLTAIEQLVEQQQNDLMKFFQEFGAPSNVAKLLETLKSLKERNCQMESAVERMTHRRDQLLAIKARLSVPLHSTSFSRVSSNQSDAAITDPKQFTISDDKPMNDFPYIL